MPSRASCPAPAIPSVPCTGCSTSGPMSRIRASNRARRRHRGEGVLLPGREGVDRHSGEGGNKGPNPLSDRPPGASRESGRPHDPAWAGRVDAGRRALSAGLSARVDAPGVRSGRRESPARSGQGGRGGRTSTLRLSVDEPGVQPGRDGDGVIAGGVEHAASDHDAAWPLREERLGVPSPAAVDVLALDAGPDTSAHEVDLGGRLVAPVEPDLGAADDAPRALALDGTCEGDGDLLLGDLRVVRLGLALIHSVCEPRKQGVREIELAHRVHAGASAVILVGPQPEERPSEGRDPRVDTPVVGEAQIARHIGQVDRGGQRQRQATQQRRRLRVRHLECAEGVPAHHVPEVPHE